MAGMSVPSAAGQIPTASAIDHVGFNVPDLDQAVAFFTKVLGFTLVEQSPGLAATTRVAIVEFAGTPIELLQFHPTGETPALPGLEDHGGSHLALTIGDLDAAVVYLRAQPGVRLVREPDQLRNGRRRVFFYTPWGATIQLITPRVTSVF
jgi:catechol 2,3-dioxygenase-like lactoylglutathione lyase family enzyme